MSRVKRMGFAMWLALAGIVAPVLARDADADFADFLARWLPRSRRMMPARSHG